MSGGQVPPEALTKFRAQDRPSVEHWVNGQICRVLGSHCARQPVESSPERDNPAFTDVIQNRTGDWDLEGPKDR